ncbi:ATP-binding cassette domain-containing protein [Paenibacillus chondroitinus]|uniref:ATP-binding cassette domain-containing protein n=1 Tax=Paenibacillus chondroitinus TaxID=59842 RepID=A0ABU6DNH9_9BACL|nr:MULTISPECIES: ATP-binding cassette domain-containing protein [Paenibacillus]MCY9660571.1 ATP-binding cassette domain-containing protein [Paenibacillus anseongense]MEB4799331.1 ATP-binding cassette domain-containing protein [Paenibacillus chondroitinus]
MAILSFEGLVRALPTQKNGILFSDVSAIVETPVTIALIGTSGQGKTSLLRLLSLLDEPEEGELWLQNRSFRDWSPTEWRKHVVYVAQHAVMLQGTIEDNLRAASRIHRVPFDQGRAEFLMASLGLEHLGWGKNAGDLSGGEKQRIALIRALMLNAPVLLLDEVTASLDQNSKHAVEELLTDLHTQEGVTMIWITHDIQQAQAISQRVWFMAEGTLLEDTSSDSFFKQPKTSAALRYLQLREEGNY